MWVTLKIEREREREVCCKVFTLEGSGVSLKRGQSGEGHMSWVDVKNIELYVK